MANEFQKARILSCYGVDINDLEKGHKYLRKESDGKGGQNYIYKEKENHIEKVRKYAERVIKGETSLERLSRKEEQCRIKGGRRNVEATILLGTSKGTDGEIYDREKQLALLEEYAKKSGCWVEDYESKYDKENKIAKATESEIFYQKDGYVIKINNFSQHEDVIELFDRIALQNLLFPDVSYKLIGFTKRDGEVNAIMRQPFVQMKINEEGEIVNPTKSELSLEMERRGFKDRGGNMFTNNNYIVEDLHSKNICFSKEGNYKFIDPVIRVNLEGEGYEGKRKFGQIKI